MVHRKETFDASGHGVTIQQVNEGGTIHAWMDGRAGRVEEATEALLSEGGEISKKVKRHLDGDEPWEAVRSLMAWMADTDQLFCTKCNNFYPSDDVGRTKMAGHICGDCTREMNDCPEGEGTHNWKATANQYNARLGTRYRCEECGATKKGVATG